jgi:hypothetical protein
MPLRSHLLAAAASTAASATARRQAAVVAVAAPLTSIAGTAPASVASGTFAAQGWTTAQGIFTEEWPSAGCPEGPTTITPPTPPTFASIRASSAWHATASALLLPLPLPLLLQLPLLLLLLLLLPLLLLAHCPATAWPAACGCCWARSV